MTNNRSTCGLHASVNGPVSRFDGGVSTKVCRRRVWGAGIVVAGPPEFQDEFGRSCIWRYWLLAAMPLASAVPARALLRRYATGRVGTLVLTFVEVS